MLLDDDVDNFSNFINPRRSVYTETHISKAELNNKLLSIGLCPGL